MKLAPMLALLLPVAIGAQQPAPRPAPGSPLPAAAPAPARIELPAASVVLAKFREAMGSRAWLAAKGVTTTGVLEAPSAGFRASFELVQTPPDRMWRAISVPGRGVIENGFDGTTGWVSDPMQGPRLLGGRELDQIREEADFRAGVRDASLVAEALTVADTTIDGQRCYLVKLTWKSGRTTHDCYSAATGLTVATRSEQQTPMGTMTVVSHIGGWKRFGQVMVPTRLVQRVMGQEQVMTITDVKFGRPGKDIVVPHAIEAVRAATPAPAAPAAPAGSKP